MGLPKGTNAGNHGVKGKSGRKSAYQEKANAEFLWKIFTEKLTKEELSEILKGRHSIKDAWIAKAYGGNERFINQIVHKLFPDKQELGGSDGAPLELDIVIKKAISKAYGSESTGDADQHSDN